MNWFTKEYHATSNLKRKTELVEQDGGCEHVEADPSLVTWVRYEKDSFGPVSSHALCKVCEDLAEEEERNEPHACIDCKETMPRKDGGMWKHWDHSEMQGDEPLFICNSCRPKEVHQKRVARDKADYDAEMGSPDDFDD